MKICTYAKKCGGCQYQGIEYVKQLENKQEKIKSLFKPHTVLPIIGMDNPYYYRHKVFATFSLSKTKKVTCGIYEENSHRIVPIEDCLIQNEKANDILKSICEIASKLRIQPFNEDRGTGVLRHAYLRVGYHTNQILLVFVLGQQVFPGSKEFMKLLRQKHPEITTICTQVNARRTSVVLGEKEKILFGKGYIEDVLCGVKFQISSKSFYQVNPEQTEKLYSKAIELANINKNDIVLDAYCGIGTISLIVANSAKEVVGVELNKVAIKDAMINAKLNQIKNAKFYAEDVSYFMRDYVQEMKDVDVAIIDPPRSGSDENFLTLLASLKAKTIVYVSCNPITQVRDIKVLEKRGYVISTIQPVDMFPFTEHIENIVLMVRK
ncbi:23S rRNA (uracil(1939)-C(5))-methyltransferase RlmD [Anaerorhabdus furcosa]|uniref:23S rRNA (Uracil1939-C5)-methyltransferase n=1 Tax=Anaerorhabdus furcosa TaxID=118967 RepID=A0A1T4N380_9FIRM|nr:23S rRNA (uracil(1939)-C(5))-methyltransferase RlmD [Anaerorhabdus furcosa]SJZ73591.1 23S rRNA (uracil1939-C5)-methyltransferase [Anaerorhabdus furcosa]